MDTNDPPVPADPTPPEPPATPPPSPTPHRFRRVAAILAAVAILLFLVLLVKNALGTVSTDDAYVNSHVTFVAPRVPGQVAKVLVDDNNRVRKGDLLVELDKEPYQVEVDIKKAAVESAAADLLAANAATRGIVAQARSQRFKLQHAIEEVHNQVASLRANVAALNKDKAALTLAQAEFDRAKQLIAGKVTSHEEFDQRQEALDSAKSQVTMAEANVLQARVVLGLPPVPPDGGDLSETPPDIDQTFSAVRQAQAELIQSVAALNVLPSSYNLTPSQMVDEFYRRDPGGNIDRIYDQLVKVAPAVKQAEARLNSAQRDLRQAELNLSYCDIVSEIDGVVTRRNVNPGNNLLAGQSLMAVRSLREIWVDANFKETQIRKLRIGQPVDLETDVYGRKEIFKGRISGFTMGTGSTLALLPAENATGNFVKVVQRLPVRIDVLDYDPDKRPLFVGISVKPVVHIRAAPTGPDAGMYLQPDLTPPAVR